MKFGFRIPSLTKRIAARTSVKRVIHHNLGFKAPRGMGWLINSKKAVYNRIYNKISKGCLVSLVKIIVMPVLILALILNLNSCINSNNSEGGAVYVKPSIDYKGHYRKGHMRMPVSLKKDALKSQDRSRYYYQTRGKYRRHKG